MTEQNQHPDFKESMLHDEERIALKQKVSEELPQAVELAVRLGYTREPITPHLLGNPNKNADGSVFDPNKFHAPSPAFGETNAVTYPQVLGEKSAEPETIQD